MKKIYLLAMLILSFEKINSQVVFCPPGARWNYNYAYSFSPWPQASFPDQIIYAGDTIIGLDTLKILQHNFFSFECLFYGCSPTHIKQKGDTVFMKNPCTVGGWQILYNFAATPGSTWQNNIKRSPNASLTASYNISVIAVNTVTINGLQLKQLHTTYQFQYASITSTSEATITERLGSSHYLFNFRNLVATDCHYISHNLCYSDSSFGLFKYSHFPCDYSNPIGIEENISLKNKIELFPNPGIDFITIKGEIISSKIKLEFSDINGRLIKEILLNKSEPIDVRALNSGFYLVKLYSEDRILLGRSKFYKSQ